MDPNVPKVKPISNTDSGTCNPYNKHKNKYGIMQIILKAGNFGNIANWARLSIGNVVLVLSATKIPTLTGLYTILEQ